MQERDDDGVGPALGPHRPAIEAWPDEPDDDVVVEVASPTCCDLWAEKIGYEAWGIWAAIANSLRESGPLSAEAAARIVDVPLGEALFSLYGHGLARPGPGGSWQVWATCPPLPGPKDDAVAHYAALAAQARQSAGRRPSLAVLEGGARQARTRTVRGRSAQRGRGAPGGLRVVDPPERAR